LKCKIKMNLQLFASNFTNIDKLYYAVQTGLDTATSGIPAYMIPKPMTGAAKIDVQPTTSQVPYYSDGVMTEMAQVTTGGKIVLQGNALSLAVQADIFGHQLDGKGGIIYNKDDIAPYICIFYRRTKADKTFRYVKVLKCLFTDADEAGATADAGVKPADETINGVFFNRVSDGNWKKIVDDEAPGYIDVSSTFFTSVDGVSDIIAPTITTTIPATLATAVAVGTTFQWVMSKSILPSCATPQNFYLIKDSDGSIVGATVVYNDTTKTVTLTPSVALSAASKYFAMVDADVQDLSGNHIIPITKSFTTA